MKIKKSQFNDLIFAYMGPPNEIPEFPLYDAFFIEGITTTIDLHKKILNHQKFVSSAFDVNWLNQEKFY